MLNRKLLEILKLFKPQEHVQFRLFLQSPYFNHRSNAAELLRLYDYIMVVDAEEDHPNLEKSRVSQVFFPDKAYNEKQKGPIDGLTTELFTLIKKFIGQKVYENNYASFEENLALIQMYRNFGFEDRFWQLYQGVRKDLEENQNEGAPLSRQKFQLEYEAAALKSLNNSFEDDINLSVAIRHLDIAFIVEKIELLCLLKYQQKLAQPTSFDFGSLLSRGALEYPPTYPEHPLFKLHFYAWQLLDDPMNDQLFEDFEKTLLKYEKKLHFEKIRNLKAYYRYFWNYRYTKIGGGKVRERVFEVYRKHFHEGYFYENRECSVNCVK